MCAGEQPLKSFVCEKLIFCALFSLAGLVSRIDLLLIGVRSLLVTAGLWLCMLLFAVRL